MFLGPTFHGRKVFTLGLVLVALALAGCGGKTKDLDYQERSVYEIYSQALGYLDEGKYKEAAQYFDEVERQHPYSVWATKAKLMAAYSLYQNNKYDDAVNALDRFIAVHPGNRDVVYAYYLKALCYYEQIADVQRDQELTQKALDSLQDVVTRFPGTTYARDARLKMDLTRDHLAGQQMSIGRFYERRVQYLAAINRYKNVVDQYGDTSHSPEALERLTECFVSLGLIGEARKVAAVLGYNYPGSEWYKDSYQMVEGVAPKPGKPISEWRPPIVRALAEPTVPPGKRKSGSRAATAAAAAPASVPAPQAASETPVATAPVTPAPTPAPAQQQATAPNAPAASIPPATSAPAPQQQQAAAPSNAAPEQQGAALPAVAPAPPEAPAPTPEPVPTDKSGKPKLPWWKLW